MTRVFDHDPSVPFVQTEKRLVPEGEDRKLTVFVSSAFDEILSHAEDPPACPICASTWVVLYRRPSTPKPHVPVFRCNACRGFYRRSTGTPMARAKLQGLDLPLFIRLLSRPLSLREAARILETKPLTVTGLMARLYEWLEELDPKGEMAGRIRLGTMVEPEVPCPDCGAKDAMRYSGFVEGTDERVCRCSSCLKYHRLSVLLAKAEDGSLSHRVVTRRKGRAEPAP